MSKILKNRKGFTLVELLAVIVVLAIIILIAMPAVLNSMEKARKNSFAIEANEVVKSAQTAYSIAVLNGQGGSIDSTSGAKYCIKYSDLKTNGYIEKTDKATPEYKGSVLITISKDTGVASYTIFFTNAAYNIYNKPYATSSDKVDVGASTQAGIETCGGTAAAVPSGVTPINKF